jgi:hypothetical protein
MEFSDVMLFLGIVTAVAAPVLETQAWSQEGFEDDDGYHGGASLQPVRVPVEKSRPEI